MLRRWQRRNEGGEESAGGTKWTNLYPQQSVQGLLFNLTRLKSEKLQRLPRVCSLASVRWSCVCMIALPSLLAARTASAEAERKLRVIDGDG